jgi:Zn-dependent M28 family amino/carboxypeptidase
VTGRPALRFKGWLTDEAATSLASLGGKDLNALRQAARLRGARPVPLGVSVTGRLTQKVSRLKSPNVIGYVRGANDKQAVIFTAHYDHLGMREEGTGDRIYNGALDNASGVAGLLAIAQAFVRTEPRPGRSVYFVATTAEEAGLLGSEHLAARPPVPIDQVAANINIDGLNVWGKTRDIVLLGAERSGLGKLADQIAHEHGRHVGTDPEPERGYFFRSDHFPLAKAGVPAVSVSDPSEYIGKAPDYARRIRTRFVENDYHQPSDEFDPSWDYEGAVEDLRFLSELAWRVAADPAMPAYNPGDQFARPRAAR